MLWLGRPPYLRWFAAAMVVVAAFMWDLSKRSTEAFPFAATDLPRGHLITEDDITWKQVPSGSLHMPLLVAAATVAEVRAGDPIVPSLVSVDAAVPSSGWAVPMPLPIGIHAGSTVRLVFSDGTDVKGTVVQPASEDPLGLTTNGLVAVAEDTANAAALAAANGDLVVLVEP